jgi:hypothetical protein
MTGFATDVRHALWAQFGGSLDALAAAVDACPEAYWGGEDDERAFWYLTFHTIFWCDLYLHGTVDGFAPPAPFGLEELDPGGVLPPRVYRREELTSYLRHVRSFAHGRIETLDAIGTARTCTFAWGSLSYVELLLYVMRHTQHHVGQLAMLLRTRAGVGTPWVTGSDPLPRG